MDLSIIPVFNEGKGYEVNTGILDANSYLIVFIYSGSVLFFFQIIT